jgi:hypothetical protein
MSLGSGRDQRDIRSGAVGEHGVQIDVRVALYQNRNS